MRFEAIEPADREANAMMEARGLDALQPLGALVDERLAQAHQGGQPMCSGVIQACGSHRSISRSRR
jgi:hypothetical protein